MQISDTQQATLNQAMALLKPLIREEAKDCHFIVIDADTEDIEEEIIGYYCCGDPNCFCETKKAILAEYPGTEIWKLKLREDYNSDKENIERCAGCNAPLIEELTWIYDEFEILRNLIKNPEEYEYLIIEESALSAIRAWAFDLHVIFYSMPSCDHDITSYDRMKPDRLAKAEQRQADFVAEVVAFAQEIIEIIKNET